MSEKKGYKNVRAMRHRKKGGKTETKLDGFDRSSPDTLASLGDTWLEWIGQRGYAERTVKSYRAALGYFLTWCQERDLVKPEAVTKTILESYQRWLYRYRQSNGKALGVTTQISRLIVIQRLFSWLCKENYLPANPASELELPRKPAKTLPKALGKEELKELFALCDTSDILGQRDRCMMELFYSCGLRRSEATKLDLEDIDQERKILTVRKGKGGKSRVVPIGERAMKWLVIYLEKARPRLEIDLSERALFISGYGSRISPNYLGNWMKRQMKKVGIEKHGSCHLLRHTCATHMLDNGADIRYIQQLLGHASLETTQIYTEVSIVALQEVHARTHPHGKNKLEIPK